jgi:uncharacterized protein
MQADNTLIIDGTRMFYVDVDTNEKNGEFRAYYNNICSNTVALKCNYKFGVLDGEVNRYYENGGELLSSIKYVDGSKHGKFITYYRSGAIMSESQYYINKLQGLYLQYDENGVVTASTEYHNGDKNGIAIWGEDDIRITCMYKDDEKNGWYAETHWVDDKKTEQYVKIMREYVDGVEHGKSMVFWPNGKLKRNAIVVDGLLHGPMCTYYEVSGNIQTISTFQSGEKTGTEFQYFECGKLSGEFTYINGILNGRARTFTQDGDLVYCVYYNNGVLVPSTHEDK